MKLVDILARELEVWPEGVDELEQDNDSGVMKPGGHKNLTLLSLLADDWRYATVTRAQWQVAVDALKADEVSYSAENVSVNANYVAHTSSPINAECKIVQPEWNGEGLPPVGVDALLAKECKFTEGTRLDSFPAGTVVYVGGHANFGGCDLAVIIIKGRHFCGTIIPELLKPFRTPEQIVAESREYEIERVTAIFESVACGETYDMRKGVAAVYDAIIRRIGTKDN